MSMRPQRGYRLGVMVGDGIGAEITPAALAVCDAALGAVGYGQSITWTDLPMGARAIAEHDSALPEETVRMLESLDGWVLGPHDSVSYPSPHNTRLNPSGFLRAHFDLYANIRPAVALPGSRALASGIDLVIVRENTEGFYADRNTYAGTGEFMPTPDVAIAMGVFTRAGVERIVREAFDLARRRRAQLTVVHKANVLRLTTGLYRTITQEIAPEYPDVRVEDVHIDAMTVHLLRRPADFDVIVTENMFGDILSDLTGELAGSLGVAPSINASHNRAMAQATHGAAPDIAGRDVANPTALILSTAMLLDWLAHRHSDEGLANAARRVREAVRSTVASGVATTDLGGSAGTEDFTRAVAAAAAG